MIERSTIRRPDLLRALEAGALVLTGNARLSRSLRADYEHAMISDGREAWITPDILMYSAWLKRCWADAQVQAEGPLARLLSPQQEQALWASIIGRDEIALLRPAATARSACRSWRLLHEWRLDLDDPAFAFQEDSQAFRRWARHFRAACDECDYVSEAGLSSRLAGLVTSGTLARTGPVYLAGFYELTPAQAELLSAWLGAGVPIRWVDLAGKRSEPCRVKARDPGEEMRWAADWARGRLEENAEARLGLVVPDLSASRSKLTRALTEALDPAMLQAGAAERARPWNFSLGEPLANYMVIDTALGLLSLAKWEFSLDALGALLASPWWAMPDEAGHAIAELARRSLLDRRLRKNRQTRISPGTMEYFAAQEDSGGQPQPWASQRLTRVLQRLKPLREDFKSRAGAAAWAHRFSGWLKAAGWCEGCSLDSASYQAVEKWQETLATLSSLDEFETDLSLKGALSLIHRLAGEVVFQPQAGEAPLQVLGLLEANEQAFDGVWVLGMHDGRWPQPPTPDPFIPLPLQREHGLPGCDPSRELEHARRIIRQLAGSAVDVVFSYAQADGEEELHASPLIRNWPLRQIADLAGPPRESWPERMRASAALESLGHSSAVPLALGGAPGGSQLLKHQAACPFRAFAEHRLGASPLDSATLGLDAAGRGSLMHKALELFWRQTVTSKALEDLSSEALAERVQACVAGAIEQRARQLDWQRQFSGIERLRLAGQMLRWLELEKSRAPFKVVGFEQKEWIRVGGLEIEVKIDRVDELDDGRLVIVDYKTGSVTPSGWFGERPDDPQLPLYTTCGWAQPLAGVVFGVIRAGEAKFIGVVAGEGLLPGLPLRGNSEVARATDSWPSVLADWSRVCEGLAHDYRAGRPVVHPKKGSRTCESTYCKLAPLCRVHTATARGPV